MTTGAWGQGLVNFVNSPSTLVSAQNGTNSAPISGPVGSYYFALLISTNPADGFRFTGLYATNTLLVGRFSGDNGIAVPGWPPGGSMFYKVAGWSSSLGTTFDASWLTNLPAHFALSSVGSGVASGPGLGIPTLPLFGGATGIQTGFVISDIPGPIQIIQDADFIYGIGNGTITLKAYLGPGGTVTIPSTVNGLPVTSIGDSAFFGDSSLTTIFIPNTVTNISNQAFWNCGLSSVNIPDSVVSIGSSAFGQCPNLADVNIPEGLLSIGASALSWCSSLSNLTIPDSVIALGDGVLDRSGVTSVKLGNGVAHLSSGTIANCPALTNIILGSGLTNIDANPFPGCFNLMAVVVSPANPAYSGADGVLFDKNRTRLIRFPQSKGGAYSVPAGITDIADYAFSDCPGLTGVTLPDSVRSIGEYAFSDCRALTGFAIPGGVTSIGDRTFYACTSLSSVTIPDSVVSIGNFAFCFCGGLGSVTIHGVTSIGADAFSACGGLRNVTIGPHLVYLSQNAFYDCSDLSIDFEGDAPVTDPNAFAYATRLTAYYLPGTAGWGSYLGGIPTQLWIRSNPLILQSGTNFGAQSRGFGFTVSWATNASVVVESCTNLSNPLWRPVQAMSITGGTLDFNDPQWTNRRIQFYRVRSP